MNDIRIAVVVPDRGDRPQFLDNCLRMIERQTLKPHILEVVNYPAVSEACDITPRYKKGYQDASDKGADCILFMENDDFYHESYIETMVRKWVEHGKPELLGHQYTVYYHIGLRKMSVFHHMARSSAMNTLIKAGLSFSWGQDHNPYTDSWLWLTVSQTNRWRKVTIVPEQILCLGIKHDIGKTGGQFHSTGLNRFERPDVTPSGLLKQSMGAAFELYHRYKLQGDAQLDYLKLIMDGQSYRFYSALSDQIQNKAQNGQVLQ